MEDLVRNVMALKQCNIRLDTYFTDFYIILDHLINTTKDVELLIKNAIIVNCLGDSETVTSMINKLNRGIIRRGMCKVVIYNYVLCWLYFMTKKCCNCFNFVPCILWDFIVLGLGLSW